MEWYSDSKERLAKRKYGEMVNALVLGTNSRRFESCYFYKSYLKTKATHTDKPGSVTSRVMKRLVKSLRYTSITVYKLGM